MKELNTNMINEKSKKDSEIDKLKRDLKTLKEEASLSKDKSFVSEEEIKQKAQALIDEYKMQMEQQLNKERGNYMDEISRLNKQLDTSRKEMEQKVSQFEKEKIELKSQLVNDTKTDAIIEGT